MSNAAAAGPSRGLLDVIFGSNKGAEEPEADGQGFESLMNFIKTMNGEKKEEQSAVLGRTLRETTRGKDIADSNVDGTPGSNNASAAQGQLVLVPGQEEKEKGDRLQELSQLLGLPVQIPVQALPSPQPVMEVKQEPIPGLKPEQVNAVLKQKDLPPLTQEELKLLQAVNSKLEQVQAPKTSELPKAVAGTGAAAVAADQALDPRLQQEMAKKGIDPRKLKSAESPASPVSGTPEKILSTEAYLQMHESMGKAPVKEAIGKGAQAADAEVPLPQSAQGSLTSAAVAGASSKGLELGSRKERDLELSEGTKQGAKLDGAGGAFGAALAQQSKEISQHEVNLTGLDKPGQAREALMNEVGPGVALHAYKGGGEMRLVVTPEDMGEVKLKISTKNGKVEVQATADNNDVAQILRGGSRDLEASLKDQNLSLSKFEVTVADSTSISSLENKTSLNEQFLSQNQSQHQGGFGQGTSADDGRNARWGNEQHGRQGASYASVAEDNGRSSPKLASAAPRQAARSISGRLDVVA